jgi:hypothetical protein
MIKTFCSLRSITRLAAVVSFAAIVLDASAASAQPSLGSAQSFAVLGATTVTSTGLTVVTGNLGVSPGTAITGFPPGVVAGGGTIHAGDMVAAQAQADAHLAYAGLKAMPCPIAPGGNNLTGQVLGTDVLSLPPGVYCFKTSAQLTGTLSLTGGGPWIFQIGTALTTASNSSIVVVGTAPNCGSNVFWQIGSSASLGTGTQFVGNILAMASITLTIGTSTSGSAVALTAAVTMDTNSASVCSTGSVPPPPPPPDLDKCEDRHDKDHDGDDRDKDHRDRDRDRDHDKDRKDHDKDRKDHDDRDHESKDHGNGDHGSNDKN